ncbi:MAG: nicotinamide-nucleotide amidohydrolase family protein [Planctomycetes bacterium]|nr:nicotinamide-nucleotide amidohydrolase family protein [Planctomycetota bacterium]
MKGVVLVSIGEELLQGRILDRNAPFLAQLLLDHGLAVTEKRVIGDGAGALESLLQELRGKASIIITTGGLGPTADDRVRAEVSNFLGLGMESVAEAKPKLLAAWQRAHKGEPPAHFCAQGEVPIGATSLKNAAGTAWGFACELGEETLLLCLPGPPHECRATVMEGGGLELLRGKQEEPQGVAFGVFHTSGAPESVIEEQIRDLMEDAESAQLGMTASEGGVSVSVLARRDPEGHSASEVLEGVSKTLYQRLGGVLWGRDDQTLERVVVGELLKAQATLAVAESCTGGRLASAITNVSGASEVFGFGWATYANEAKVKELSVPQALIDRCGAVSQEVALAMAKGARAQSGATWALSTTGVAGPSGGTEEKPVGLVYLGVSGPSGDWVVRRQQWARAGRSSVQKQTVRDGLEILRRALLGMDTLPNR